MKRIKLFSESPVEERLYSTGNNDLDYLLEKAFCDGYDYAMRQFSEEENPKKDKDIPGKVLLGGTGVATGVALKKQVDAVAADTLLAHIRSLLEELEHRTDSYATGSPRAVHKFANPKEYEAALKEVKRLQKEKGKLGAKVAGSLVARDLAAGTAVVGGTAYGIHRVRKKIKDNRKKPK